MLGDFSTAPMGIAAKQLPTSRARAWAASVGASEAIWDSETPGEVKIPAIQLGFNGDYRGLIWFI